MDRTAHDQNEHPLSDEPRVTIEMGGDNIVIRSTPAIDQAYTTALAHAVDAASDTDTVVVIDPDPIRCDDSFAHRNHGTSRTPCLQHRACRPIALEVVASGIIRIAAEHTWWYIDLGLGRFCQTDSTIDVRFLHPREWTPVIAICITPTMLSALTHANTQITSTRAHDERLMATG